MCRLKDATHVVTSTTTGFNAYMLFEKESKSSSEKQVIEGSFKLAMNSMGVLDVNAEASAKLSNEEKEVLKTLKFKFYGDTIIDPPPANYDDAIQAYKNLPSLAKTSKKVLSFNLSPLSAFCSQTDDIIIGIDDSNVEAVSKIFEDFDSFNQKLRELQDSKLASDFSLYGQLFLDIQSRYRGFQLEMKKKLRLILPKIRSQTASIQDLMDLLADYSNSAFKEKNFDIFLGTRKKEIQTIEGVVYSTDMPREVIVELGNSGDANRCTLQKAYSIQFEMDILPQDPTLLGEIFERSGSLNESGKWFMMSDAVGQITPILRSFKSYAKKNSQSLICFVMKMKPVSNVNSANGNIKLLKYGVDMVPNANLPNKPTLVELVSRDWNYLEFKVHHSPSHFDCKLQAKLDRIFNDINHPNFVSIYIIFRVR